MCVALSNIFSFAIAHFAQFPRFRATLNGNVDVDADDDVLDKRTHRAVPHMYIHKRLHHTHICMHVKCSLLSQPQRTKHGRMKMMFYTCLGVHQSFGGRTLGALMDCVDKHKRFE